MGFYLAGLVLALPGVFALPVIVQEPSDHVRCESTHFSGDTVMRYWGAGIKARRNSSHLRTP